MNWQEPPSLFVWLIPLIGVLNALIMLVASIVSGWRRLARHYRCDQYVDGQTWWFQSASMRFGTSYGACLIVTANSMGMRISLIPPFNLWHPPLFIPWSDINVSQHAGILLSGRVCILHFAKETSIPFHVSRRLVQKIIDSEATTGIRL